jgi:hypothetical protein
MPAQVPLLVTHAVVQLVTVLVSVSYTNARLQRPVQVKTFVMHLDKYSIKINVTCNCVWLQNMAYCGENFGLSWGQ